MAHNFKRIVSGAYYVSKSGHDSNDGLSPDTPKRTLSQSNFPTSGSKIVVGAGHYTEGGFTNSNWYKVLLGDGKVILDGITNPSNNPYPAGIVEYNINLEYRNMNVSARQCTIGGMILKNCTLIGYVSSSTLYFCTLIDTILNSNGGSTINPYKSIIVRCTGEVEGVVNSYVDKLSSITMEGDTIFIRNCNYRGVIKLKGTYFSDGIAKSYAVQDQLTGTPQENSYTVGVNWFNSAQLTADGYTGGGLNTSLTNIASCINRDPLFNNEALEDYTLQAGSPHINAADDGSNIGGTDVAISVINTDHNGTNIKVIPGPQIDTSIPDSYKLNPGEIDGYIDYIVKIGNKDLILEEISPISLLNFNSDQPEGSAGNNNVPDSEPLTLDYPRVLTTTSAAADSSTLNLTGHDVIVGEWVRVQGQAREVTAVTANTITVASPFRAIVGTGVEFRAAAFVNLAATNPNRLTYLMRTSVQDTEPTTDAEWDNNIDPVYQMSGAFLTQEWDKKPGYVVDILNGDAVYGAGDSEAPVDQPINFISCQWINIRVYIRNNYDS